MRVFLGTKLGAAGGGGGGGGGGKVHPSPPPAALFRTRVCFRSPVPGVGQLSPPLTSGGSKVSSTGKFIPYHK